MANNLKSRSGSLTSASAPGSTLAEHGRREDTRFTKRPQLYRSMGLLRTHDAARRALNPAGVRRAGQCRIEPPSLSRRLPNARKSAFGDGHHTSGAKIRPGGIFAPRRHSLSRGLRMQTGRLEHRRPIYALSLRLSLSAWCEPRVGAFGRSGLFPGPESGALRMRCAPKSRDAHTGSGFSTARARCRSDGGRFRIGQNPASGYATEGSKSCRAEFRRRM